MAIEILPNEPDLSYYEFTVELDGAEYVMTFRYNSRDSSWYMSISDTDGTPLRMGIRVVESWPLLTLWAGDERPGGDIVSVVQGSISAPPGLNQLGSDVVLAYVDAETLRGLIG